MATYEVLLHHKVFVSLWTGTNDRLEHIALAIAFLAAVQLIRWITS